VKLLVKRDSQTILVLIEDDGKGFDPSRLRRARGLGLIGLKERVSDLSGLTQIKSEPGKGTQIAVHLPLESEGIAC
jgi:signal transduction histidine kinase